MKFIYDWTMPIVTGEAFFFLRTHGLTSPMNEILLYNQYHIEQTPHHSIKNAIISSTFNYCTIKSMKGRCCKGQTPFYIYS